MPSRFTQQFQSVPTSPVFEESIFQACLDSLTDLVYIVDIKGVITYINTYGAELLGYTVEEVLGLHFLDIVMPKMRLRAGQAFARLIGRGELINESFQLCTRSGNAVLVQVNSRRLLLQGKFGGFTGVARVVSSTPELELTANAPIEPDTADPSPPADLKPAVLTAKDSGDDLFRAYVEAANDIVYTLDLRGKFAFLNDYGLQLFGYPEHEIVGKYYLDFVASESREATATAFANLLDTGELRDYEFVIEQASGDRVFLEVNGRLLYRDGELIGGLGIGRDITERKRVEQQLKMFSKALDAANDSAIITDLSGTVLYANQATQRIFGYSLTNLLDHNVNRLYPNPAQSPWLIEQAKQGGWSGQVICQRQDAQILTALVSVGPVCDEAGEPTAVSIIYRDITQLENIKAELASKNLELQRANQLKSQFLANMSHELRTPMTSILGFSSLLEQEMFGPLNERQMLYVQQIYQSGEHLLTLINEVLDLSKIEAGQMALELAPVIIDSLCHNALTMVSAQITTKGLTVHQHLEENLPPLIGDELRLRQMLLNLLSNAIKFSNEGAEIGLEVRRVAHQLLLTVWDKGIGIPSDQQGGLFQPFQQLDSSLSRRHEGTGLGLALTRRLATMHGGDVSLESVSGQGSRFTICLPLSGPNAGPKGEPLRPNQPDSTVSPLLATPQGQIEGTVLIVEDHPVNAILLEHMLTYWGYETFHALNGQIALEWLETHQPTLILMDIHLPELDGLALTQKIRQNPSWQDIPIVATTALAMDGDRDRCLDAGMQDYLSKPINSIDLVSILAKYTWRRGS